MTTKLSFLLLLLSFVGCKPNFDKVFAENTETFNKNRNSLNECVNHIESTYIKSWDRQKSINIMVNDLDNNTLKTSLSEMGIDQIEIALNPNDSCEKNYWITFNIAEGWNIRTLRVVQLVYAPCDDQTQQGYHYYDGYHQDFLGEGDDWFIYSDTDFI